MAVVFEPSHPPFWCKTVSPSLFHYLHNAPSSSAFYDLTVPFMPGPARTAASQHRSSPVGSGGNPPRPPNAWILYRSDKLKALPPPPPGMPRQPQADISKTISAMWKTEHPEIRARYERLSDIKKAEHQVTYPGYRFQPMKKADRDRLRAEKQAEKERVRGTRRSKARTRASATQDPPPLYTTEARFAPAGPSPPASAPPVDQSFSQQLPAAVPLLTPPTDHTTPPGDHPSTPAPPTSSPSPYPPSPAATAIPPLVAPQPGVLQRPPSASGWPQPQPNAHGFNSLWLEHNSLPDTSHFAGSQEYLRLQSPGDLQRPLGWSLDDPGPTNNIPSFNNRDPLHAVIYPTNDPYAFDLANLDFETELFDGSREIEVSMGATMTSGFNQFTAFTDLLASLDTSHLGGPSNVAGTTPEARAAEYPETLFESFQSSSANGLQNLEEEYSIDNFVNEHELPGQSVFDESRATSVAATEREGPTPYVPPAGAANSSTRRVAADWRHIREPEPSQSA